MRVIPLCVVALGGWLTMPALAADDAFQWLKRLAEAEHQQSYAGDFVYQRNGSFSTHAIWQRVAGGEVRERLLQLDGSAVEVAMVDGRPVCATQGLVPGAASGNGLGGDRFDPRVLTQSYELRVIGDSRVAGRDTVALAILPRDQHRYGMELHLDRATGLPLKSLLLNEQGQLLERFQYTRLDVGDVTPETLRTGTGCKTVEVPPAREPQPVEWRSDWLPPGFEQLESDVRSSPAADESVAWLSYGDGLARFSVFIEPLRGEVVQDARSQMGPTVAVSKRVTVDDGDVMVTVVGEIPLGTAERIALSMRKAPGLAQQ
ncbi:MucB/RseB C-terminal domain-containing protein [Stutzerimonas azotifigens]|uniref:MucB/RseB C-terminal domain-containing protein n=1 Tax=Stutzerimonas azotifigens TaxID=291995 RepID=UPI00041D2126|nr:MucB/RseB C-terminal domain-containing protein [Stutzerimonas azotifigens]